FAAALEQGSVASSQEVAAMVMRAVGETLTARRQELEQALKRGPETPTSTRSFPPPLPARARRSTFPPRRARPFAAIALVLLGSIGGGVVVWFVARAPAMPPVAAAPSTPPPAPTASEPPIEIPDFTTPAPIPTQTTA